MAFYNDNNIQEDELLEGQNQSSGQSASLSAGAPGAQANAAPGKQSNPGNFVGITNYLNANKNQASELGNQVGGVVSSSIEDANTKIGEAGSKFGDYANKSAIAGLDNASNDATTIVNKAANTGKLDETDTTRFGQIANANYTGPKTLQDAQDIYNPAYESYNKAKNISDLTKSEEGSQELTKKVANKNLQYTPGENRLDSYLLNTQENKQKLADARANAANLDPALQAAQKQAGDYAKGLADKTTTANKTARDLLSSTALAKKASVQSELDKQKADVESANALRDQYAALFGDTSDAGNLALTPEQMNLFGLSEGENLYGALNKDPSYYLPSQQVFDPNKAISKDNQAQLAALANLASGYGGEFTNPYAMADLAGTAQYEKLDGSKLKAEAQRLGKEYETKYKSEKGVGGGISGAGKIPGYSKNPYGIAKVMGVLNGLPPIDQATTEQLETQFLPAARRLAGSDPENANAFISQIQGAINSWKNKMHAGDKVTKKQG